MNKKNHDNQFDARQIKRYLEGNLSPLEMHKLEKAALEDPMLADAIEGMRPHLKNNTAGSWDADIESLRNRIKRNKKPAGFTWWKVAAIFLVVATGITITLLLNQPGNQEKAISQLDNVRITPQASAIKTDTVQNDSAETATTTSPTKKEEKAPIPQKKKSVSTDPAMQRLNNTESAYTIEPMVDTVLQKEEEVADNVDAAQPDSISKVLQGRAAGVNVTRVEAKNREPVMDSNSAELSEVVVVGYGNKKAARRRGTPSQPQGGWDLFQEYIQDSSRLLTANHQVDSIQLGFTLNEAGKPVNITVIQGATPEKDREAARLLAEGPSWIRENSRKKIIRVIIIL